MKDPFETYKKKMESNKRWNDKAYRHRTIRIHRDSVLDDRLGEYMAAGGSVNFLIAELLAGHFGVGNPYKQKHIRKVERLYTSTE